jgi:hypothetical protein
VPKRADVKIELVKFTRSSRVWPCNSAGYNNANVDQEEVNFMNRMKTYLNSKILYDNLRERTVASQIKWSLKVKGPNRKFFGNRRVKGVYKFDIKKAINSCDSIIREPGSKGKGNLKEPTKMKGLKICVSFGLCKSHVI